jgi:enoyl-CoA hydratase/carnithine racemase
LAVVHFKNEIFELLTNIEQTQALTAFIQQSEHDRSVRGLAFFNEPGCLGEEAYEKYIKRIVKDIRSIEKMESPEIVEKDTRFRQINILGKFMKSLAYYQKLFITCIESTIVTPFIGVVLVADIRLASPDAAFSMAHKKYGLHPSGSIPLIFPSYTGAGISMELQLSERIEAGTAFRLGLINQILPADNFMESCIRYVQPYLKGCPSTLRLTRRLNSYRFKDINDYLELEASLLNL